MGAGGGGESGNVSQPVSVWPWSLDIVHRNTSHTSQPTLAPELCTLQQSSPHRDPLIDLHILWATWNNTSLPGVTSVVTSEKYYTRYTTRRDLGDPR